MKKIIFIVFLAIGLVNISDIAKADSLPDLIIESITFNPDTFKPTIRIMNSGNATANIWDEMEEENIIVILRYGWKDSNDNFIGTASEVQLHTIGAGSSFTSGEFADYKPNIAMPTNAQTFFAQVDADNFLFESNETNNSKSEPKPKSNMIIESITFNPDTRAATIRIKNAGNATAVVNAPKTGTQDYPNIRYGWNNSRDKLISIYSIRLDAIGAGTLFSPGEYTDYTSAIPVPADAKNFFVEFNGNTKSETLPQPDLAIESITFNPDTFKPTIRVKNIGNATAFVDLSDPGDVGGEGAYENPVVFRYGWKDLSNNFVNVASEIKLHMIGAGVSFAPGESVDYQVSISFPANGQTFFAQVDPDNFITELDKSNNSKSEPKPQPDLVIDSITFNPDTLKPAIRVKNIGNATVNINYSSFNVDLLVEEPTPNPIVLRYGWKDSNGKLINVAPEIELHRIGAGDSFIPGESVDYKPNAAPPFNAKIFFAEIVDASSYDLLKESDKSNNSKSESAPKVDLVIESITYHSATRKPIIHVKNIGTATANVKGIGGDVGAEEDIYAVIIYGWKDSNNRIIGTFSDMDLYSKVDSFIPGRSVDYEPNTVPPADAQNFFAEINSSGLFQDADESNNSKSEPAPIVLGKPALLWPTCTAEDSQNDNFSVAWSWPEDKKASDYQIEVFDATLVNSIYQEWTNNGTSFAMPGTVPVNTAFFAHYRSTTDRTNVSPWSDTALVVCAKSTLTTVIEETSTSTEATSTPEAELTDDIKKEIIKELVYPIAELGNCQNQDDCKAYCEKPENLEACTKFGLTSGLMTEDEAEAAQKVSEITEAAPGPGGCTSKESCEAYCEKPENVDACLDYAEQNNIMSADDLVKARKVVQVLKEGVKTPGDCASPITCKSYCSDNTHAVECVAFGKSAGLFTAEEATEAEKVAPLMQSGQMPGGGKTREETEVYCETHRDECDQFFEQVGVKKGSATTTIFEGNEGGGPGGCQTKAECDAYCDAHPGECDQAVIEAGGEVKEVTVVCSTREECEAFCNDPANKEAEACKSGTIIIKEEPPESAGPTEGPGEDPIEKLRSDIQEIISQSQSQDCVKQILGEEVFTEFVIEGGIPEKAISREELQPCFEEAKRAIEQEEMLKMQKKPDDPDMGNPPSSGKISAFLASIINILKWFRK